MKKRTVATACMPLIAAAAIGGILVATHRHVAIPHMSVTPPAGPGTTGGGATRSHGGCEQPKLAKPFAGIATNPAIGQHLTSFQKATGAHVRVVEFYDAFVHPFQAWEARQVTEHGAVPLIQLNPRNISLAQIAAGRYDKHLRSYAAAVRAFRCTVILSFGHEMNGWWYTWGRPRTSPATFIATWRHIHDVFAAQHANNVIWSWDPTHQYQHKGASLAAEWYPGNAYVDWIGIDGYLGTGQTFADVFGRQLRDIRKVSGKPVYIAETGVGTGPGQGARIRSLFAALRTYKLTGLVWFDLNRKQPWQLEGRPAALAAYRKAVAGIR